MTSNSSVTSHATNHSYRRGDLVTIRSQEEILATLDEQGRLDGLPFMPEMAQLCGQTFSISRHAHRTCVEGAGMRAMDDTVLLKGVRCNGAAHEGCQRQCLFFWKKAWLKPAGETTTAETPAVDLAAIKQLPTKQGDKFYCQSTELVGATHDLPIAELRYYWQDFKIGEATLSQLLYATWIQLVNKIWQHLWHINYYRQPVGKLDKTESVALNLQAGEWVEVRSIQEIEATLDQQGRNRGLRFEFEMARHCGRRFRVAQPLRRAIFEKTGQMLNLKNTVILEGQTCEGICARNCPRGHYFWWREIWLKRVEAPSQTQPATGLPAVTCGETECSLECAGH